MVFVKAVIFGTGTLANSVTNQANVDCLDKLVNTNTTPESATSADNSSSTTRGAFNNFANKFFSFSQKRTTLSWLLSTCARVNTLSTSVNSGAHSRFVSGLIRYVSADFFLIKSYYKITTLSHSYTPTSHVVSGIFRFDEVGLKTTEEIAREQNIFTSDTSRCTSWADELDCFEPFSSGYGYGSIDTWDMCLSDPGMEDFLEIICSVGEMATSKLSHHEYSLRCNIVPFRDLETRYLSQAGTSRIFIPAPFTASPSINALSTPWFLDFGHLAWWFFFFAMFVLIMWLVLTSAIIARNVESRQPVRETRGFSRAQTGDGITAVLPMTWSITMLMHASTHSVNFDENTTGTTFMVSVIAYQWGWNYYFPRDIVSIFWSMPRLVGRGGTENFGDISYYDSLLNHARKSLITKQSNASKYSSKLGKNTAPNLLSLFLKSPFIVKDMRLPTYFSTRFAEVYKSRSADVATSRSLTTDLDAAIITWTNDMLDEAGLVPSAAFTGTTDKTTLNCASITKQQPSLMLTAQDSWSADSALTTSNALLDQSPILVSLPKDNCNLYNFTFTKLSFREDMLRYRTGDALRSKNTLTLGSNRLLLIHDHYNNWRGLLQHSGLTHSVNQGRSGMFGANLFFDNLASLQNMSSFLLRDVFTDTTVAHVASSLNSTAIYGTLDICNKNVSVSLWSLFYDLESAFTHTTTGWNIDHLLYPNISYQATWSNGSNSLSANRFNFLSSLIAGDKHAHTLAAAEITTFNTADRAAPINAHTSVIADFSSLDFASSMLISSSDTASSLSKLLSHRNTLNTNFKSQLLTTTGSDNTQTFYLNSLLSYEDFGLNTSPAVKELMNKSYSYAAYSQSMLLNSYTMYSNTINTSLYENMFNLFYQIGFDQSSRFFASLLDSTTGSSVMHRVDSPYTDQSTRPALGGWNVSNNISASDMSSSTISDNWVAVLPTLYSFTSINDLCGRNDYNLQAAATTLAHFYDISLTQHSVGKLNYDYEYFVAAKPRTSAPGTNLCIETASTSWGVISALDTYHPHDTYFFNFEEFDNSCYSSLDLNWYATFEYAKVDAINNVTSTSGIVDNGYLHHYPWLLHCGINITPVFSDFYKLDSSDKVTSTSVINDNYHTYSAYVCNDLLLHQVNDELLSTVASFSLNPVEAVNPLDDIALDYYQVNDELFFEEDSLFLNFSEAIGFENGSVSDYEPDCNTFYGLESVNGILWNWWFNSHYLGYEIDLSRESSYGCMVSEFANICNLSKFSPVLTPTSAPASGDNAFAIQITNTKNDKPVIYLLDITSNHFAYFSNLPLFSGRLTSVFHSNAIGAIDQYVVNDHFTKTDNSPNPHTTQTVLLNVTSPVASIWYNGVDLERPIRSGQSKIFEPSFFVAKLDTVPSLNLKFSNKILLDWSLNWSSQTQKYATPLYKLYRGGFLKKPFSGFWSTSSVSSQVYDKFVWSEFFSQVTKTSQFTFVPKALYTINATQQLVSRTQLLDTELIPFVKNNSLFLPNPHEEFDINFVYQHWAPEINTTRRSDHSSRFKVTWNAFFTNRFSNKDTTKVEPSATTTLSLPNGSEFFQKFSLNKLLQDNVYSTNFAKKTYGTNAMRLSASFKPLNIIYTPTSTSYELNMTSAYSYRPTTTALSNLQKFSSAIIDRGVHDLCQVSDYRCIANLFKSFTQVSVLVPVSASSQTSFMWPSFWNFKFTSPATNLDNFKTHASDTPAYFMSKLLLAASSRDKELVRVLRNANIYEGTLNSTYSRNNSKLYADVFDMFSPMLRERHTWFDAEYCGTSVHAVVKKLTALGQNGKRSAYEIIRNDIGSMRRLRVTKGICLPADYPIHLVCASKDVIHSWAIPGLGVKIDCIPGYNSHRRVQFRWRGIYWGQCMEVCGRYHHWMPILVRIVHRDVFLSWCLTYLRALNNRSTATTQSSQLTTAALRWLHDSDNALTASSMLDVLAQTADVTTYDSFVEAALTLKSN